MIMGANIRAKNTSKISMVVHMYWWGTVTKFSTSLMFSFYLKSVHCCV